MKWTAKKSQRSGSSFSSISAKGLNRALIEQRTRDLYAIRAWVWDRFPNQSVEEWVEFLRLIHR